MTKVKNFLFIIALSFFVPAIYAEALTLQNVIENAKKIVGSLVPLIIGLALVYFIYGLAQYISVSGEAAKKEEGRTRMLWGTIAMFVIVSIWGLVSILTTTVFTPGSGSSLTEPPAPNFRIK